MDQQELDAMTDEEVENLALTIPVSDPRFRTIFTEYERRKKQATSIFLGTDTDTK